MDEKEKEISRLNFKGLFTYITTVLSWTLFTLLIIIGALLLYYFISVKLYATYGDKFEPKFSVYTIVSPSMEPTISVYDVIVNTKVDNSKDIKVNDVITFISSWQVNYGMTITHRVVGIKNLDDGSVCYITRGDNNTNEDQACVSEKNVIGVVKGVIPGLGKLQSLLASKGGWLLLIICPALYVLVKYVFRLIGLIKNDPKDKSAKSLKSQNAYDDLEKVKSKE